MEINKFVFPFAIKITASLYFILLPQKLIAQEKRNESKDTTINLKELVVEAKREIHTVESDIITLSKKNREFGTNALDAISSLRQFNPVINGTELFTTTNRKVSILINGRPSTPQDLRGYSGTEIKNVTYYPVAPPRYSDITDGPIIDVEVRIKKNYINAFLSASNSLNVGYGTNQAVVRFADSLNLVRADYFIDYRSIKRNNTSIYRYPGNPTAGADYLSQEKYKGHYQYGKLSWQNTAHNNILYLSAMFINNPGSNNFYNKIYKQGSPEENSVLKDFTRVLESSSNIGNISTFFRTFIGRGRIDTQINGSIGKSTSDNMLEGAMPENLSTSFINNTYSATGKIHYFTPVNKININVTGNYIFQRIDHKQSLPAKEVWRTDYNTMNLSASLSGKFRGAIRSLSYSLGVGMNLQDISDHRTDLKLEQLRFSPTFNLSSMLSSTLFMRLRGNISSGTPTIGQLYDVPTYTESNLAWSGNSGLKGWTKYSLGLHSEYGPIPGKLLFTVDLSYNYVDNPIRTCVEKGTPVMLRSVNLNGEKETEAVLFINIVPSSIFTLKPFCQWNYTSYKTPTRDVDRGYFRYGTSVMFYYKHLQIVGSANAPYKTFNGDVTEYGDWQYNVTTLLKLPKNFTVSIAWSRSAQNDWSRIESPHILNYLSTSKVPRMANMITVGLTWNLSHGIFKRRIQPQIDDTDVDTGLTEYNKAKQ